MKGIIIFKTQNASSKSEGLFPFLYQGEGVFVKLYYEGDNPFENQTLKSFDAQKVDVEGEYNDNNLYIVEKVELATETETEPERERQGQA